MIGKNGGTLMHSLCIMIFGDKNTYIRENKTKEVLWTDVKNDNIMIEFIT